MVYQLADRAATASAPSAGVLDPFVADAALSLALFCAAICQAGIAALVPELLNGVAEAGLEAGADADGTEADGL